MECWRMRVQMQAGCQKSEILKNGCGMEIFQRSGAGFVHFDRSWCRIVVNLRRAVRGKKRKSQLVTGVLRRTAPPFFKHLRWPLALLKLFQNLLSYINPRFQRMTFSLDCISWPLRPLVVSDSCRRAVMVGGRYFWVSETFTVNL